MQHKMILGRTLLSFFREENQGFRVREVRFLNRDENGEVNGSTRMLYDEKTGRVQRFVNGSAPIASLSDDMVCFLSEVSRCLGKLRGDLSWEKDVWLCVDTEVRPEITGTGQTSAEAAVDDGTRPLPMIPGVTCGESSACCGTGMY